MTPAVSKTAPAIAARPNLFQFEFTSVLLLYDYCDSLHPICFVSR
jgi:hypothetical protein